MGERVIVLSALILSTFIFIVDIPVCDEAGTFVKIMQYFSTLSVTLLWSDMYLNS